MPDTSARRRRRARLHVALAFAAAATLPAGAAAAQGAPGDTTHAAQPPLANGAPYPLAPSPVFDARHLTTSPSLGGYVAVRQTRRNDSTLFAVSRARVTVMVAPRGYLAVRLQADLSNVGRVARDSSVAASLLTDAYLQLTPPPSSSAGAWYAALEPALLVGQFRSPFSLEYLTPFSLLKTVNRSAAVDRLSLKRDIGAMAQLGVAHRVTLAGALLNGGGPNATRNPDDRELAVGRITLRPVSSLALSGKWGGEGPDHLWGYDARWLWRGATVEGEALHRQGRVPGSGAVAAPSPPYAAGGGYVLAAYRVLPWLEPVLKWERFREERAPAAGGIASSERWLTVGATVATPDDHLRLQANWIDKRFHPLERHANELVAQLIAVY